MKRRIISTIVSIVTVMCLLVLVFVSANGAQGVKITEADLTKGRSFADGEAIQLGKDLAEQPRTYEFVVYVPTDVDKRGSILSNFFPIGGASHIDLSIGSNGRPALDIKQQLNDTDSNRTQAVVKRDIRGDSWVHVAITHEARASEDGGDIYTFYINGEKISSSDVIVNYWINGDSDNAGDANFTHNLDMSKIELSASMYLGQAAGYSSKTELGADDPYNSGVAYSPTNFKGRIKNLALYSTVLTEGQIKSNYEAGIDAKRDGIILCYDLTSTSTSGESKSGYITDLSGNGYNTVPLYHERTEELDANDFDYSFAILGDTQFLVDWDLRNDTEYFKDIYDWIIRNKDAKKIARVLGVGDIVESGRFWEDDGDPVSDEARAYAEDQWEYAVSQFARLEAAGIPYTITWGYNHDGGHGEEFTIYFGNSTNFTNSDIGYYFSDPSSEDYNKRLANYYQCFTVEGVKYMVMCIEYRPNSDVLAWADSVIKAKSDHRVIINTHYFLDQQGNISQQYSQIQPKWDKLANENANVEMIICGHVAKQNNVVRAYTVAKSGQTVAQFLFDPQQLDRFLGYDDTGLVAMLYFSNGGKDVRFELVSTSRTMRAIEKDADAEDILYGHKNSFRFDENGEKAPAGSKGEVDIYVIAGQSNAVGYGRGEISVDDDRFTNGFENVLYYGSHEYYGSEDLDGFIPVKLGLGQGTGRSGAEIGIAYKVDGNGKTTIIIKCAQGATPLYPIEGNTTLEKYGSWTPPSFISKYPELVKHENVGLMYEKLIALLESGMGKLITDGYIVNVKGVLWLQGEAETGKETVAAAHEELLTDLIGDLRVELSDISGKDCSKAPFVIGEITSNHINVPEYVDEVCAAQLAVANELDNVFVLDTTGLEQQDSWHYTAESQRIIGERFIDIVKNAYGVYTTPYGDIPNGLYDPTNKPLAVFASGKFIDAFDNWATALGYIKDTLGLHGAEPSVKAQIVLLSDYTPSGAYFNMGQMGGTLTIDLNGFTLSGGDSAYVIAGSGKPVSSSTKKMCTTTVIVKNGYINVMGKTFNDLQAVDTAGGDKNIVYTFDNISFSFREGATATSLSIGVASCSGSYKTYADITFNNCTFDLSTNAPTGAYMFALNKSAVVGTVKINGGKIIKSSFASGSLYNVGNDDTVTFGKYNGSYTALELPASETPVSKQYNASGSYTGKLAFAKSLTLTDKCIFTLTEITTKYGDIPTGYLSTEDYPFVVFVFNDGELVSSSTKGYSALHGNDYAIHYAKNQLNSNVYSETNGYDGQYSVVILMRRDYMLGKSEAYYNHGQIRGVVTYDLNGYTLSQSNESGAKSIMYIQTKPYSGYDTDSIAPSYIEVINGNMVTYSAPIISFAVTPSSNENYTIGDKDFGINFKDVNFSLGKDATVTNLMLGYATTSIKPTTQDPSPMASFDVKLEDCYIDLFQNVKTGSFTIFNLSPTTANATSVKVCMAGGTVRGREWDGSGSGCNIKFTRGTLTNGSSICFEKSDGKYLTLRLIPGADAPSADTAYISSAQKSLTFGLVSTADVSTVYTLGESTATKYGDIPFSAGNVNENNFALFVYDAGTDKPRFVGIYKQLLGSSNGVFNEAKNALQSNEYNNGYDGQIRAVILQLHDYTLGETETYANFAQIRGEVTYDLGGYTLSQYSSSSAKPLFAVTSKPWGSDGSADGHLDVFPTTINIENGKVLTYNGPIFNLGVNASSNSPENLSGKLFTFNLNKVTLGFVDGASAKTLMFAYENAKSLGSWSASDIVAPFEFNLTDCLIDLDGEGSASGLTVFDLNCLYKNGTLNCIKNTVTVSGGEIRFNGGEVKIVDGSANGSALTFDKAKDGKYTRLILPLGTALPTAEYGGLVFVKIATEAGNDIYTLKPGAIVNFKPSTSITLDANLIFNVYIPENSYLTEITLDGKTYAIGDLTATDGKYRLTVELPSAEAGRDVALTVTFGDEGSASYTLSILKYASKLLADEGATATEKTLVCNMLAYVKSAYTYFGTEGAGEIASAIDAIIGTGASSFEKISDTNGSMAVGAGVNGVTFILDAEPRVRFYLEAGT
ncbi:MAG: hypothetical protein IJF38_03345, partial [Clostridia bacterium]|nr:hypothetical protein [Clostridia bacterium]